MRRLLGARGLAESDYSLVVGGGTAERFIAFRTGAFDAAMLPGPEDIMLRNEGYTILGNSKEVLPNFPFLTFTARREWAEANRDILVRWLRAMKNSIDWMYEPANREGTIRAMIEGMSASEEAARLTYDAWIVQDKVLYERGEIDLPAIQSVMELMVEQGDLQAPLPPPTRFADLSYQEAAIRR